MSVEEIRDVAGLVTAIKRGERFKYIFFWGHTAGSPDRVGVECMSQWYPASFEIEGVHYATSEHYMMAEKARLFDDQATLLRILAAPHPGAAKQFGREVRGYDDARWSAARYDAVVRGNMAKFNQNPALREVLRNTGERVLVEASPVDRVWGIGRAADDPKAASPEAWRGENLLGFALMEVRSRLATADGVEIMR